LVTAIVWATRILSTVETKFLSLAATDPFNPEIGPAYFTMRRLGLNLEDSHKRSKKNKKAQK